MRRTQQFRQCQCHNLASSWRVASRWPPVDLSDRRFRGFHEGCATVELNGSSRRRHPRVRLRYKNRGLGLYICGGCAFRACAGFVRVLDIGFEMGVNGGIGSHDNAGTTRGQADLAQLAAGPDLPSGLSKEEEQCAPNGL